MAPAPVRARGKLVSLNDRSTHVVGFLKGLRRAIFPGLPDREFPAQAGRDADRPSPRRPDRRRRRPARRAFLLRGRRETLTNPEVEHVASSISYLQIHDHFHRVPEARRRIEARVLR